MAQAALKVLEERLRILWANVGYHQLTNVESAGTWIKTCLHREQCGATRHVCETEHYLRLYYTTRFSGYRKL